MVMLKRFAAPLVLVFAMACTAQAFADAAPTEHQVYEAAAAGHLDQAQKMMDQVLRDHPTSARAHFVEAELAARARDLPRARQELARAQQLDPSLSFEKPEAVQALQRELARGSVFRGAPRVAPARSSVPWGMILLIVAGVAILWAVMRRRSQTQYGYQQYPGAVSTPAGGPGPGYGPGGGYGPGMGGGGMGSGIVGGLASGLAIGAGVAAGEELVRHMVDGREGNVVPGGGEYREPPPQNDNDNMGGSDFGSSDGGGSWDDGGGSFGGGDGGGGGGGDWS